MSSGSVWHKEHAANQLAWLLRMVRVHLANTPRAVVCRRCQHVFSRDARLDMRCPGCAAKAAEAEAVRL
jgi:Zn finger protein HypA/HybF involved in hydrogenase expression